MVYSGREIEEKEEKLLSKDEKAFYKMLEEKEEKAGRRIATYTWCAIALWVGWIAIAYATS